MNGVVFILVIFFICVVGCWWLFTNIGNIFLGSNKEEQTTDDFDEKNNSNNH